MTILYSTDDHVATITLNRPEALNSIDPETREDLARLWAEVNADDAVRVIVLTGAGDRAFCTGSDLKKTMPPNDAYAVTAFAGGARDQSFADLLQSAKPVIAAINGYALAGGLEIALASDLRIAADTASFGLTEVKIGSIPGAGGTQRLPRIVGLTNAMHMLLTAERIDATEALRIGLVSRVVPAPDLMTEATAIATRIAANAPLAVRAVKRLVYGGLDQTLEGGIASERMAWGILRNTEDRIEGRTAFKDKRAPVYRGK